MAFGDGTAAAAKGLDVVAGTQSRTQGARNHNWRGDEIAKEIDDRTAADALKLDAAKVLVQAATPANVAGTGYSGRIWIKKA